VKIVSASGKTYRFKSTRIDYAYICDDDYYIDNESDQTNSICWIYISFHDGTYNYIDCANYEEATNLVSRIADEKANDLKKYLKRGRLNRVSKYEEKWDDVGEYINKMRLISHG